MNGRPLQHRGLRLDGPIGLVHRAVDGLRGDTLPTPLDHQPPTPPSPARRRRDPGDGQAVLLKEPS